MQRAEQPFTPTWKYAALRGAEMGAGLTFAYTLLFVIYASIRSMLTILQAGNVDAGVLPTILATTASLLWTALVAAALFVIPAIFLGALSGVLIFWVLRSLNPQHAADRAVLVGLGVTAFLSVLVYVVLGQGINLTPTPSSGEALAFWLGLPVLIYIAAGGVGALVLNTTPANKELKGQVTV